jgi:outer membrane lipoprotein SlyB
MKKFAVIFLLLAALFLQGCLKTLLSAGAAYGLYQAFK